MCVVHPRGAHFGSASRFGNGSRSSVVDRWLSSFALRLNNIAHPTDARFGGGSNAVISFKYVRRLPVLALVVGARFCFCVDFRQLESIQFGFAQSAPL